jgi:hypothetical protein
LRTAASIFALVYRTGEGEAGEIGVSLTRVAGPAKAAEAPPTKTPDDAPAKTRDAALTKAPADFSVLGDFSS